MTLFIMSVLVVLAFVVYLGMESIRIQKVASGLINANTTQTISDNAGVLSSPVNVLPAQPAILTTYTSSTAGTLTMTNSGHGIITGQQIDLYWASGSAYSAIVGTVAGTSVPFASANGTALPIATTPITVGIPISTPFAVTGNNVTCLVCYSGLVNVRTSFVFSDGSSFWPVLISATSPAFIYDGTGTYPLAGHVPTVLWISNEQTTGTGTTTASAAALVH